MRSNGNYKTDNRLVLRNAKLRIDDYIIIFLVIIFTPLLLREGAISASILVITGASLFFLFRTLKRANDRSEKVIIDEKGITINYYSNPLLFEWSEIKYVYIEIGNNLQHNNTLRIETIDDTFQFQLSELKYNAKEIGEAINHFSGRDIGSIFSKLNARRNEKEKDLPESIYLQLHKFYKSQTTYLSIVFFVLLGITIYLQVILDFPYVFAIGLTLIFLILIIGSWLSEKHFKETAFGRKIDDETYLEMRTQYEKGVKLHMGKRNYILGTILLILALAGIFYLSYYISK